MINFGNKGNGKRNRIIAIIVLVVVVLLVLAMVLGPIISGLLNPAV